jgi:glycogen debranching enzyme
MQETTLHLSRSQFIRNGVYYEEISIKNYGANTCRFDLSLFFGADFRDLFEVRGINRSVHANKPRLTCDGAKLFFDYEGLDKTHRRTEIVFSEVDELFIDQHTAHFTINLPPQHGKTFDYFIVFRSEETFMGTSESKHQIPRFAKAKELIQGERKKVHQLFADIFTSNEQFSHWINRSKADLISLLTPTAYGLYPYAGVPWYNTAFGRDGIITAMEVLWIAPEIARNALLFLARMQAMELNPSKDAEPGKILHETRSGEMANTGEIPFKEYYGTIDATPLYIMLAGMYYHRTADLETIRQIWPNIEAALTWIDQYGDLDGDGFVEYQHKAENGLTNQGWKDSYDSIMYSDGTLCEPPITLCEVQGYVYGAKNQAADLALALNNPQLAERLKSEASLLKERFNRDFWDEETGCFALALDKYKKPCKVVSSNPGHCLFTGIVKAEYAERLSQALLSPSMFSGWGIRTLSVQESRYNPMSYHNGSVWPHDNALIAAGLAKYGYQKEAKQIMSALFRASLFLDLQRLPELYCGFDKRSGEGPTDYPVACSPQAWSVAAVYLLLQACLQVDIDAPNKTISFHKPVLPDYLHKIRISNLNLGNGSCDFELHRYDYDISFHILRKPEDWSLIIRK